MLLQKGREFHLLPIGAYLYIVLFTGEIAHFQSQVVTLRNEILELGDLLRAPSHASIEAFKHRAVNGLHRVGQKLWGDMSDALRSRDLVIAIINKCDHNTSINFSLDLRPVPLVVCTVAGDTDPSWSQAGRIQLHLLPAIGHEVPKLVHHVFKVGSEFKRLAVETRR